MNIQQFNHLVNSTSQMINDEDTKRLESLVTSFPYCQTGHLLLSKASREQGSMLSEMKVKTASAYSVNRRHLKKFLLQKINLEQLSTVLDEAVVQEEKNLVKEDTTIEVFDEENVVVDEVIVENVELKQESVEIKVEEKSITVKESVVEENKEQEEPKENKSLSIAEEIHQSLEELRKLKEVSTEITVVNDEEIIEIQEDVIDKTVVTEIKEVEEQSVKELEKEVAIKKEKVQTNKEQLEEKKKSPAAIKDKLKALSKKVKEDGEKKVKRKKKQAGEVNHYLPDEDLIDSKLGESGGAKENSEADLILRYLESIDKKKTKRASRKSQDAILDNFIKNEPQISRVTAVKSKATESQEDFSKGSGTLKIKVVNENMAKIHAKQGNTAKAIKIYQALIVKKPEKKSYFANQIEKLKKEQ